MTVKKIKEGLMVAVIVTLGIMTINMSKELDETKKYVNDLESSIDTMQDVTVDHEYVINELLKGGE